MSAGLALVAGGSRGLGLGIARRLVAGGHPVVICGRSQTQLDAAADDLRSAGGEVHTFAVDVADHQAVETMISEIESGIGPLEIAFCVAGIIQVGPLDSLRRGHFEEAIDVMAWGPINVSLAVLPGMRRRRRGRIGIVSSIGGVIAAPHLLPYSTAKFAATGFARGLRSELVGTGVSVTAITPGLMRTGSHLHAKFVGEQGSEYSWFAAGASLPLLSMDADRAATLITDRTLQGRSTVMLTPLAHVASRVAGISPSLTAFVLSTTTRMLPSAPSSETPTIEGAQARQQIRRGRGVVERVTTLGNRAAKRFLQ